jgi:phenylacetate-coenzyme A ligase PaaK-like adenylate-forming protein
MAAVAADEQVWQYQVVQKERDRVEVVVVPVEGSDRLRTESRITAEFRRILGGDVSVGVEFVRSIKRTEGGKVRVVLSQRRAPLSETAR